MKRKVRWRNKYGGYIVYVTERLTSDKVEFVTFRFPGLKKGTMNETTISRTMFEYTHEKEYLT